MNLKACSFERLAFISLGFGRGAQVGKTLFLEVEFITAQASTLGVFIFYLVRFRPRDPTKTLDLWKKTMHFFLQCKAKIVRRHTSRQRSGVASQQRLRPRRFDSTVKRVPKLKFELVSFLF